MGYAPFDFPHLGDFVQIEYLLYCQQMQYTLSY